MKKELSTLLFSLLLFVCQATPAPDFTITTTDGVQRQLYNDYVNQGKVLVFEVFFTSCPPCSSHAPSWQALYQNMLAAHPGQVEFLILSTLTSDMNSVVATYRTNKGLTMPGAGSNGGSQTALQPYTSGQFGQFQGTPTFVVIAPGTGEVHFDIRGNSPQNTMDLLAQKIADLLPAAPLPLCNITSPYGSGVPDVNVQVTASGYNQSTTTDNNGNYSLEGLPSLPTNYTITPSKDADILEGLSTFDLVRILKHILDIEPFTEPWQLIAADLNCSGAVTTFDIATGRKFILGIYTTSPDCPGTWYFEATPPGQTSNGACLDFLGIRRGDLTGMYLQGPADDRSMRLWAENRRIKRGETLRLRVHNQEAMRIMGLQLGLGFDAGRVRITDVCSDQLTGFCDENINLNLEGYLPVSWISERPVDVAEGAVLMTIALEVLEDGLLSDMLYTESPLASEAYTENGRVIELGLDWRQAGAPTEETGVIISPNPNRGSFTLGYESRVAERVTIELVNAQGRVVLSEVHAVQSGANRIQLEAPAGVEGMHFLRVKGKIVGRALIY